MNSFWFLQPSIPSRLAEEADDTKYGRIVCPLRDGHTRGRKRIGALSIIVSPSAVKDFTFSWSGDILLLQRMLDLFGRFGVSGFEAKRAKIAYPKKTRDTPPDRFELVVTGWGGWAAPAAGLSLVESCSGCGHKVYAIAEPSRLIDAEAWDGSDLVWPLPGFRFVSGRLASILRQEKVSGVRLIPASELTVEKGAYATPGSLSLHMPESRARELDQQFRVS
jgi:hypothetical protein